MVTKTKTTEKQGSTNKPSRPRPDAVLVKPAEGKSYADVLQKIKDSVDPCITQTVFKTIRCIRGEKVVLELQSTQSKNQFSDEVRQAVRSDAADVWGSIPKTTLEIHDIDACATEDEVRQAIAQAGVGGDLVICLTDPNNRGQRLATANVQETETLKLLKTGELKVGWVICRVRRRIPLVRCFRCLDYGHHARDCKGTDRSQRIVITNRTAYYVLTWR